MGQTLDLVNWLRRWWVDFLYSSQRMMITHHYKMLSKPTPYRRLPPWVAEYEVLKGVQRLCLSEGSFCELPIVKTYYYILLFLNVWPIIRYRVWVLECSGTTKPSHLHSRADLRLRSSRQIWFYMKWCHIFEIFHFVRVSQCFVSQCITVFHLYLQFAGDMIFRSRMVSVSFFPLLRFQCGWDPRQECPGLLATCNGRAPI